MKAFILTFALSTWAITQSRAAEPTFQGKWWTSLGIVRFEQKGDAVTAKFEAPRIPPVKGKLAKQTATLTYQEGNLKGDASLTLDESGRAFTGWFSYNGGQQQSFNGWRPDPLVLKDKPGRFGGLWLTSLGLMDLTQHDTKVNGRFGLRGGSAIDGTAEGGHLESHYKAFMGGRAWFDIVDDGSNLVGAAVDDGSNSWFAWTGRSAPEYVRHAELVAGKTIDGSTQNLLTYSVHATQGYKASDKKAWPTIVILHGSNMNAKAYVDTIASAWPDIAHDFLILGINGERPSSTGPEPAFNFSYVNYVGKSTYGGFPGTDRESPALVSEALTELKGVYPVKHYLVGGHSQGGYLAYSLLMNFPELIAGAFPVSGEVMFICEPGAYADEPLKKAQRKVPLAIVHGKNDPVVGFSGGRYASNVFGEANWPALRFFTHDTAGHMFALLPVDKAILWLEALASDDPETILTLAETRMKEKGYHDVSAAILRLRDLKLSGSEKPRLDRLIRDLEDKARPGASALLPKIKANANGAWIEGFLAYRDDFEFAPAAKKPIDAFAKLRAEHLKPGQEAFNQARGLFQQGKQDEGYAKYQEIVDKHYASPLYRIVKPWLDERKK